MYAAYLEFDRDFVLFSLKLLSFIFAVWFVLLNFSGFGLLLAWEIVGFVSLNLIGTWSGRSNSSSSAFSAVGFNRIGDVGLVLLVISWGFAAVISENSSVWLL